MTRKCALMLVPLLCAAMLAAGSAPAAEDLLGVMPEKTLGFATINGLAKVDGKLVRLGERMQLPASSPLAKLKETIGIEKGLDEKGRAAIVVMPGEDADSDPIVLLFAPVTNFKQFVGQLEAEDAKDGLVKVDVNGAEFLVGNKGGYAVFAEPKHRDVLVAGLASSNKVAGELATWSQWLASNDATIVITRSGVELLCSKLSEEIKNVQTSFEQMPEEMRGQLGPAVAVFDVYRKMFDMGGREVQAYGAAVQVDGKGNLLLTDRMRFTPNGAAAKAIAGVKPAESNWLAGLPASPFVIAGGGVLPESLMEAMMGFSMEMMKAMPEVYGVSEEQAAELGKLSVEYMKGLRSMSMVMGVGEPGTSLYESMAVIMKVDDAKKFMANYEESIRKISEMTKGDKPSMFSGMKVRKIKFGDADALELSMKFPELPGMENVPDFEKMAEAMFGPGGKLNAYIVPADDHTVVAAYVSKANARKCLKLIQEGKGGLAENKGVARTAALLPKGAQWIGYFSPAGTVQFINNFIPTIIPDGGNAFKLPEFSRTPPIGFAAKVADGEVHGTMAVPAPVIKAVGEYVQEIQKMIIKQMMTPKPDLLDEEPEVF
ncbi:MAG: hypothetical protein HQ567_03060 [Candidatus Nealsonbacteria bacterium]|nr:hypothetical protein [Candidatus Nealsonbacteria bacterium]